MSNTQVVPGLDSATFGVLTLLQVEVDGSVRIVDRKKDLVKLQFGE